MTSPGQIPNNEAWLRPVEQLVLPALENKIRVLGITSPTSGAGVTTLSHAAAETLTRSGAKVLLIDFSRSIQSSRESPPWTPGEGDAAGCVQHHSAGYDVLTAVVSPETRFLFNNGKRLRRTLFEELSGYGCIIIDLPPLLDDRSESINAVATSMVCDQVLLLCANERTSRSDARAAVDLARAAGVKMTGAVWNNLGAPPLGLDMARVARRHLWFLPGLSQYLDKRLSRSPFLNA